ncbi:hypothetical protein ACOMHN_026624 [Nucella lapillus]
MQPRQVARSSAIVHSSRGAVSDTESHGAMSVDCADPRRDGFSAQSMDPPGVSTVGMAKSLAESTDPADPPYTASDDRVGPIDTALDDRVGPIDTASDHWVDPVDSASDDWPGLIDSADEQVGPVDTTPGGRVGPVDTTSGGRVGPADKASGDRVGPHDYSADTQDEAPVETAATVDGVLPLEVTPSCSAPAWDGGEGTRVVAASSRDTRHTSSRHTAPWTVVDTQPLDCCGPWIIRLHQVNTEAVEAPSPADSGWACCAGCTVPEARADDLCLEDAEESTDVLPVKTKGSFGVERVATPNLGLSLPLPTHTGPPSRGVVYGEKVASPAYCNSLG